MMTIHTINGRGPATGEGFGGFRREAAQAHWPTERREVIREARAASRGKWPAELTSGVMFYMGERITRAEFDAARSGGKGDGE